MILLIEEHVTLTINTASSFDVLYAVEVLTVTIRVVILSHDCRILWLDELAACISGTFTMISITLLLLFNFHTVSQSEELDSVRPLF